MLRLRRLAVFLLERLCEALLLGVFLVVLLGPFEDGSLAGRVFSWAGKTFLVFMVGSGYLLTTALAGVVWRSRKLWRYPAIAAGLFAAHYLWFWAEAGGWSISRNLAILAAGVVIVFACTFVGNLLLRRWAQAGESAVTDDEPHGKRLAVFSLERLCEALLLGTFLVFLWRPSGDRSLAGDVFRPDVLPFLREYLLHSLYLPTTLMAGVIWRSRKLWRYPTIAAGLFTANFLWLWEAQGHESTSENLSTLVAGVVVVFACTIVGNLLLRRWVQAGSK